MLTRRQVPTLQARQHAEAEARLKADHAGLLATVHRLSRDLSKLEAFKRSLAQTLQATDAEVGTFLGAFPSTASNACRSAQRPGEAHLGE